MEVWNAGHRKAVARLSAQFQQQLSTQACYFWFVFENYNERKAATTIAKVAAGEEIVVGGRVDTTHATACDQLPVELWQHVCSYLHVRDLVAMRLTSKAFSDIAAEFLITTIRLDTDFESFKQLKYIANHPNLRKGVRKIIFEAGLQSDLGCIHHYKRHYDLPHHGKPQPPEEKSGRTARLYARNLDKFNREIDGKYGLYRKTFESQQLLVNQFRDILYPSTLAFQNLRELRYHSGSICHHNFSERFRQKYVSDCAIPQNDDPAPTVWQLERLIKPGLTRLHMSQVSPKLFDGHGMRSRRWLRETFAALEKVNIGFRQDREDAGEDSMVVDREFFLSKDSLLPYALQNASKLDFLQVNFMPNSRTSAATLDSIMPSISFEKLARLDLDYFTATADGILQMLKAQPKLYWLALANVTLSAGRWSSLATKMRRNLRLEECVCAGYLEDAATRYMMNHCCRDRWSLEGVKYTFAMALDSDLTDHDEDVSSDDDDGSVHGGNVFDMYADEYDDPESLLEQYGPPDNDLDVEFVDDGLDSMFGGDDNVETADDPLEAVVEEELLTSEASLSSSGDEDMDVDY